MRSTLLAATLALWPAAARGGDPQAELDRYVGREYVSNGVFAGVGAVGVASAAVLFSRSDELERAAAWPVAVIGSVQLVVGALYLATTPGLHARRTRLIAEDVAEYRRREGARIDGVVGAFPWFVAADAAVVAAGAVALGVGLAGGDRTVTGVGVGALASGVVELALDLGAYWIARRHRDGVRSVGLTAAVGYVGVRGVF
ncbi:MAG: hypothetical protein JWM10_1778 [Myxococcaceae bacterium]|nr:hypothetical protein [Myxococcaceae bacterium]